MRDGPLVALVRDAAFWRAAVPLLSVTSSRAVSSPAIATQPMARAREQFMVDGYFRLPEVAEGEDLTRIREAMPVLLGQGWPPIFVFLFEEPWRVLASMRPVLRELLGDDHVRLAGFWAWCLAPGDDAHGWRPHRDRNTPTIRAGRPELLTLWVAVTSASPDIGCIYVLPAPRDPNYFGDLSSVATGSAIDIRAVPAPAGTLLGWTQQLLHWGSRSSAWAEEPRISFSMEFQRGDIDYVGEVITAEVPSFEERLRLIGMQIQHYIHMEPHTDKLRDLAKALASISR